MHFLALYRSRRRWGALRGGPPAKDRHRVQFTDENVLATNGKVGPRRIVADLAGIERLKLHWVRANQQPFAALVEGEHFRAVSHDAPVFAERPRRPTRVAGLQVDTGQSLIAQVQDEEAGKAAERAESWKKPEFRETFLAQWRVWLARELKSSMWNTFAIIGVTQLVVLPFVATPSWFRALLMFGFGIGHALLTHWFNWGFVMGDESNWMVQFWKTGDAGSHDGGFFGPLC